MKTIAVYGSLKKGKYNHREGAMRFIGHSSILGSMFMCYSYPHLYPSNRSLEEQVTTYPVEIYEVSDDEFTSLDRMESGAGYTGEVQSFEVERYDDVRNLRERFKVNATIWFKNGEGKDSKLPYITEY